jgi:MYXO-CTERM domain-containing protein
VLLGIASAATLVAVALGARDARACGGCFHPPTETGTVVTDHRMIFVESQSQTTLYDQIEYSGSPSSFAWVLPIHGTVTVGLSSDALFQIIDQQTTTTIQRPLPPTCPSQFCPCDAFGAATSAPSNGSSSGHGTVNVLAQAVVGPYETVQLESTDPNALTMWLTTNGYAVPSSVAPIIAAYVNEGFNFLAIRLVPGQGVQAMRPVSVTSTGAGVVLPLRMVAAGTGATVGITLWVLGQGRYEPMNFKSFTIAPSDITWDWSTDSSNYTTVRTSKEASYNDAAWQIESSISLSPLTVQQQITNNQMAYAPVPGTDGGVGRTALQEEADDLATLFPDGTSSVRVTRMRADLSRAALATDLTLQASQDQSELSNDYPVTKQINVPACAVPRDCSYCNGSSGSSSGSFGGSGSSSGSFVGVDPVASGASSGAQSMSGSVESTPYGTTVHKGGGGCSAASSDPGTDGIVMALLGMFGIAVARPRRRTGAQGRGAAPSSAPGRS